VKGWFDVPDEPFAFGSKIGDPFAARTWFALAPFQTA
jgi:hypothetical protein